MNTVYAEIIQQIRNQCLHNQWFGPPELKPNRAAWAPQYHPNANDFAFPPATENQLQQTEAVLGFQLPPLLRTLYTDLANGGFGPGAGIWGAMGGYGSIGTFETPGDDTIIKHHASARRQFFDLNNNNNNWIQLETGPYLVLPPETWPRQIISISDLGCAMEACIDMQGHFFIRGASQYHEDGFFDMGISFEQWLKYWLQTSKTWAGTREIASISKP